MTSLGSACSGYGGLDEAVRPALGGVAEWFVEFADAPSRVLAHHWPGKPNHHDATTVDWASLPTVDTFCAGYSCQPFSLAGRRQGAADERHVWPFLARGEEDPVTGRIDRPGALAALRPRLAVFENVAGHLSLGFDQVLADLDELGYDAWWTLWNASDVGAPHRRRRLFVLAIRRDAVVHAPRVPVVARRGREHMWAGPHDGLFGEVPFTDRIPSTGVQLNGTLYALPVPAVPGRSGLLPTPRTSDAHGAGIHGNGGMDLRTAVTLLPTPTATAYGNNQSDSPGAAVRPSLDGLAPTLLLPTHRVSATRTSRGAALRPESMSSPSLDQAIELSQGVVPREFADEDEMPRSWRAALLPTPQAADANGHHRRGGLRADEDLLPGVAMSSTEQGTWGAYSPAIERWERILGRPAPSPTMTGKRGGQQLAPAFVEWMMALPEGHVTGVPGLTRGEQLKLLGNGVCPPQAEVALRWLAAVASAARLGVAA